MGGGYEFSETYYLKQATAVSLKYQKRRSRRQQLTNAFLQPRFPYYLYPLEHLNTINSFSYKQFQEDDIAVYAASFTTLQVHMVIDSEQREVRKRHMITEPKNKSKRN